MSSIRFVSLAALALVALTSVACAPASSSEEEETTTASAGGAGNCEATCTHYLACKGISTPANQKQCVTDCKSLGLSSADMATYEQSDCASAVAAVDGNGGSAPSTGSSSSGGSNTGGSNECDGCVADGSYCIWTSKSDWGKGSYSGAVTECASHCCQ